MQVITTNFLHRDDDSKTDLNQEEDHDEEEDHEEEEDHDRQEAVAESLEEDNEGNAAEFSVLEVEITPDSKDLSGDYSDDENNEEELQPLVTSPSLSEVANRNVIQKSPTCQQSGKSLSNERPSPNMPHTKGVTTKLCKNIARIVGETMCLQTGHCKTKHETTSNKHLSHKQLSKPSCCSADKNPGSSHIIEKTTQRMGQDKIYFTQLSFTGHLD